MIFEHEIPSGSRLYFGESARLKRVIETKAADMLGAEGYEEIVTPIFSHQQHDSFADRRPLVRLNDEYNHEVSLRADSTADVVRIVTKRLGRANGSKKWFYIQPVFTFPTTEQYQIGAEVIDGGFVEMARMAGNLLAEMGIDPIVQIANIAIPRLLSEKYGVEIEHIERMNIDQIVSNEHDWIESMVRITTVEDIEDLSIYPDDIAFELAKMAEAAQQMDQKVIISPLYFARLRYYDTLVLRMFRDNSLLATGGTYQIDDIKASGFAVYTDACIAQALQKDTNE